MNAMQARQHLLVGVAGWINRHQLDLIAYMQEENKILGSKLRGKRARFIDDKRRRLAVKANALADITGSR